MGHALRVHCFKQYLCLLVSLSINYLKGQIPVRLLRLLFNSVLWLFVLFVLQCQRVMCKTACAVWVLVDLFSADNSMCGQAAFLFQSAVESRDWSYVSIHGFCGQLLLWAIRVFFTVWFHVEDPLNEKGYFKNKRWKWHWYTMCPNLFPYLYPDTESKSTVVNFSEASTQRHPPASIHHKIPLVANILVIDFSSLCQSFSRPAGWVKRSSHCLCVLKSVMTMTVWIACINIYQNDMLAWIYTVDEGYLMLTSNASPGTAFFVTFGIYAERL